MSIDTAETKLPEGNEMTVDSSPETITMTPEMEKIVAEAVAAQTAAIKDEADKKIRAAECRAAEAEKRAEEAETRLRAAEKRALKAEAANPTRIGPPPAGVKAPWSIMNALKSFLQRYTRFAGRASLAEFWYSVLFCLLVTLAVLAVMLLASWFCISCGAGIVVPVTCCSLLLLAFWGVMLVPCLSVTSRRLQDTGLSKWWMLLGVIPLVGWLALIYLLTRGTAGANQYGTAADYPAAQNEVMPEFIAEVVRKSAPVYHLLQNNIRKVVSISAGAAALLAGLALVFNFVLARPNPLAQLVFEGKIAESADDAAETPEQMFCAQYEAYLNGDMELKDAPFVANLLSIAREKGFRVPVEVVASLVKLGAGIDEHASVVPSGHCPWCIAVESEDVAMIDFLASAGAEKEAFPVDSDIPHVVNAVRAENEALLRTLVRNGLKLDIQKDVSDDTALMVAVKSGNISMLNLLIELGASVNAVRNDPVRGQINALDEAVCSVQPNAGEMIDILVKAGAKGTPSFMVNQLFSAVDAQQLDKVRLLLAAGAPLDIRREIEGDLPLHAAVDSGNLELVKILVDAGSPLNELSRDVINFTPLMKAVRVGNIQMVRLLLQAGADVNVTTSDLTGKKITAQHMVRVEGNPVLLALLSGGDTGRIEVDADAVSLREAMNMLDKNGITETKHITVNNALLKGWEYGNYSDSECEIGLSMYGAPPPCYHRRKAAELKKHLNAYVDGGEGINDYPYVGMIYRLAHWLSLYKEDKAHMAVLPKIIKAFLASGADLNKFVDGDTALQMVASYGDVESVRFLLENGADPRIKGATGMTVYQIAQADSAVSQMLQRLAPENPDSSTASTAFSPSGNAQHKEHTAPQRSALEQEQIDRLVSLIAALESTEYSLPELTLHRLRLLEILPRIADGASVNTVVDQSIGTTALHHAAGLGHYDAVRWLIENGADCSVLVANSMELEKSVGNDPDNQVLDMIRLHMRRTAAAGKDRATMDDLVKELNQMQCSTAGETFYQKRLLSALPMIRDGADVDMIVPDTKGNTALHYSCALGSVGVTKWLLDYGANPNAETDKGKTPMQCVGRANRQEIIDLLKAHGGHDR